MRIDERGTIYNNSIGERGEIVFSNFITEHGIVTFGGEVFTLIFTLLVHVVPSIVKSPQKTITQNIVVAPLINFGRYVKITAGIKVEQLFEKSLTRSFIQNITIPVTISRHITRTLLQPIILTIDFMIGKFLIFIQGIIITPTFKKTLYRTFNQSIKVKSSILKTISLYANTIAIKVIPSFEKQSIKRFIQSIKVKPILTKTVVKILTITQPIYIGVISEHGRYLVFVQNIIITPTLTWAMQFKHTAAKTVIRIAKSLTSIRLGD